MAFVDKVKSAGGNLLPIRDNVDYAPSIGDRLGGRGPLGFLVDKAERWGGPWLFGAGQGYYREKWIWRDVSLDAWIGGALTIVGAALSIFSNGASRIAPHANALGDVGIGAYTHTRGVEWGHTKANRTIQVLEGGKPAKTLAPHTGVFGEDPLAAVIGAVPPIAGNADYLSDEEMMKYSAPRT